MSSMTDYEAFEEQYRRPVLATFESRTDIMKELILTVIVLGLVLNILANTIWSMFDPIVSIDVQYYKIVVSSGSVLTLVVLGLYLIRLRFRDLSSIELSFRTVLVWDSIEGRIPQLEYAVFYIPQMDLETLLESDEMRDITQDALKIDNRTHNIELKVARQLFERVLFLVLGSWRGPTGLILKNTSYSDILGQSNPFVSEAHSTTTALSCPGHYDVKYEITTVQGGNLTIRWSEGFRGTVSISYGTHTKIPIYSPSRGGSRQLPNLSGMILSDSLPRDVDPKKLISGIFNVRLHAKFSPLDLSLNLNHSRALYNWVKFLFDDLRHFMDWDYTRFRASRATFTRPRPSG